MVLWYSSNALAERERTSLIPHYIIHDKNDWLKSMGYIVS